MRASIEPIHNGLLTLIALAAACLVAVPSANGAEDLPGDASSTYEDGMVLVRFSPIVRGAMVDVITARHRATVETRNDALDYVRVRLAPNQTVDDALQSLRSDPLVVWAEPNHHCKAFGMFDAPQDPMVVPLEDKLPGGENQWGVFHAGIPWLWRQGGVPGDGVIVAIVDTGIDDFAAPHPDLAANVHPTGRDFVDDDASPTDVGAAKGHGTHVAGIVAAAANGTGIAGVAYGAKIMVVRVLDCSAGSDCPGNYADMADGIQYAADNGARVINLSLGGYPPSQALRTAVQYAIGKGCILVAAAGNDSLGHLAYPARYPEVIAVGASDSLDHVPAFSNSGEGLDLVAPGTRIWSAIPGPGYKRSTGTSQASPLVAGTAAIVAGRNPAITQLEMERYLTKHVVPLAGADGARDGAGRLGFLRLEDWSDLPPPYGAAHHRNYLWEWLGYDASAEASIADPLDADFRPNLGSVDHKDGHDNGVFPLSNPRLPFLPPHIGTPTATLDIGLGVSTHDGPRYGAPSRSLHIDTWIDWNSDGSFGGVDEHVIDDHTEDPATWPGNAMIVAVPFTPLDTHILGNPLTVRTRVSYGSSTGDPDVPAKHGEVEDYSLVNFVEDFDLGGVYTVTDSWGIGADPEGPCGNHGTGGFAKSAHPAVGAPCNGFVERINVMATPEMDWTEFTAATVKFWFCHQGFPCSALPDRCRIRIDADGVKTDLGPIPIGSGLLEIGLDAFVGHEVVRIEFVEETDRNGYLKIDDLTVKAFDSNAPEPITTLALARSAGDRDIDLAWTATSENDIEPSPPTEAKAHVYDLRYATSPITTAAEWNALLRVDPRDVVTGVSTLVPGTDGSGQAATVSGASAFQAYNFAIQTQDEVNYVSSLSNSPGVASTPTLGVTVLPLGDALGAPGDTVVVPWHISNDGNIEDSYAITGESIRGWSLVDLPSLLTLDGQTGEDFLLRVAIPITASGGEQDTVTLVATSLASAAVLDQAESTVLVEGEDPTAVDDDLVRADGFRIVGSNPIETRLDMELALAANSPVSVKIYSPDGRLVHTVVDGERSAGRHRFRWDVEGGSVSLASGTYFLDARVGEEHMTRRLVVLK